MESTLAKYKIAVAGTGYVGLSNAVLLAQHNEVKAVDLVPEKVEMLNNKTSPIEGKEFIHTDPQRVPYVMRCDRKLRLY